MLAGGCVGHCSIGDIPPPDSILSMPPPPLPAFLLPKLPSAASLQSNDTHPCYATFMCEPNPRPHEGSMEFVEYTGNTNDSLENTWLFVLISSCVGVFILGGLLAVILLKCRDCTFSYHDNNIKQGTISALGEPSKTNPFLAGGILYPCTSTSGRNTLQRQLTNDSRLLWATLTPHGTRHFISDYAGGFPPDATATTDNGAITEDISSNPEKSNKVANPEVNPGHYEIVDYRGKMQMHNFRDYIKGTPVKSFDNNGFIDYDYEDPTPLMDSYHDDMDSGYQEPQEVIGTMTRASPRLRHVSSPTRIEHPNIAPLNYYPLNARGSSQQGQAQSSSSLLHSSIHSLQRSGAHVQLHNLQPQYHQQQQNPLHPYSQHQYPHQHQHHHQQQQSSNHFTTLNRKSTLNRRISDAVSVASFN